MSDPTPSAPEMAPQFDPQPVETRWSQFWLETQIGQPNRQPQDGEKTFCLTIPPPNVTGVLHLGHALQHTIHDCLLRYHRMKGEPTLCIPGTDHAGIGTQIKVQDSLREEGLSRFDLGREKFEERTWQWKEKYGGTIIGQLKSLGCSYDWSRERFTMDEGYVRAVLTVFKAWFDRGLIYRGLRLINWSSGAQTTVSDLEIDYREVQGALTHIKYPIENSDEFVIVATTRPETMLGDTAVAVHPDDARYSHLRGKNLVLPLQNRPIPLVFDDKVDKEFGTGAVKITPAHDPNDYEMGTRHGLAMITVIGFDDKMTAEAGDYVGMEKTAARKKVVADLKAQNLIEKIESYTHSVGHCARTGVVIEPLLSEQWFVNMKELARPVADAIRLNRVHYWPERFANTSLEWLDNIRDWCISRQLWWGHRIPIFYGPNGEVKCSLEPIEEAGWTQDEDVLDTWFSSALWPFAVLGWPDNLEKEWYPTSVLITGRDILNLWVSRMILTSLDFVKVETPSREFDVPHIELEAEHIELEPERIESEVEHIEPEVEHIEPVEERYGAVEEQIEADISSVGQVPFHDVFVHPTVQDVFGLRMSKSLGTGIDPMELIEIYGADATRFGLLQLATGTQDVRFIDSAEAKLGETKVRSWMRENPGKPLPLEWSDADGKPTERYPQMQSARNFANKIWNAARLVLSAQSGDWNGKTPDNLPARWIVAQLNQTIEKVTDALENYEFESATSALYSFIWGDFCDWFLETSKSQLREGDQSYAAFMAHILETTMRLLHPFMPFLSEEIWHRITGREGLSLEPWPTPRANAQSGFASDFALIQDATRAARNLRAQAQIAPSQKVSMTILAENTDGCKGNLLTNGYLISQLANLETLTIGSFGDERPANAISEQTELFEVILPLEGLIDTEKERAKLEKQLEAAQQDWEKMSGKLQNPKFVEKAPPAIIEKDRARVAELEGIIGKLKERLAAL